MSFAEIFSASLQGVSVLAVIKIAIDLGKFVKTVENHDKRLDRIESHFFESK